MGMSIDKAILRVEHSSMSVDDKETADFIKNIMRKYQQIEEIYKNWCYPTYFNATDAMNKLGEVLKDGRDNN